MICQLFCFISATDKNLSETLKTHFVCSAGEDSSLLSHLEVCGGVTCPSYHQLLKKGFAGIFQASLLVRLWDKLIGGSSKVLVYVMACALFR